MFVLLFLPHFFSLFFTVCSVHVISSPILSTGSFAMHCWNTQTHTTRWPHTQPMQINHAIQEHLNVLMADVFWSDGDVTERMTAATIPMRSHICAVSTTSVDICFAVIFGLASSDRKGERGWFFLPSFRLFISRILSSPLHVSPIPRHFTLDFSWRVTWLLLLLLLLLSYQFHLYIGTHIHEASTTTFNLLSQFPSFHSVWCSSLSCQLIRTNSFAMYVVWVRLEQR